MALEDTPRVNTNISPVFLRLNDVLIGIIAGAVCSVLAAGFEAFIVTLRFFSVGHLGGGIGSKFLIIALLGAVIGGFVGFIVGKFVKPREPGPGRLTPGAR
jgi:hypothetical protein